MRLERIDVGRLRGGAEHFEIADIAPGLNLVFGPNGSGKSSLCAAVRVMLWPELGVVVDTEMVAWWRLEGRELRAELRASGRSSVALVDWQSAGLPIDRPDVPSRHLASVYTLGLRDLLADDHDTDVELARRIRVEMAGGFDVASLRVGRSAQFGRTQENAWLAARDAHRELEGQRRELAGEADRLDELRVARDRAAIAQRDLQALRAAFDAARLRDELAQSDRRRDALRARPEVLDLLRGDERDDLHALVDEIQIADEECAARARTISDLEAARTALELPDPVPDAESLSRIRQLAAALRRADAERSAREDRLAGARQAVEVSARELSGDVDMAELVHLDAEALDRAEGWVSRAIRHATRRAELLGAIESAGDERVTLRAVEAEAEGVRRRADALRDWLSSPVTLPPRSRASEWIMLICGLALGVLSYWTSLWLLAPAGALLGAALARFLELGIEGSTARPEIEARWREMPAAGDPLAERVYARLRFEAPLVRAALAEIEAHLADLLREHAEAIAIEERRRELARVEADLQELAANRAALARRSGIDPGLGVAAFSDLLDRVRRRREAESVRDRVEGDHARIESELAALRAELEAVLPGSWVEPDRDAQMVAWLADDLIARVEKDATLRARLVDAREQERAADSRRDRVETRRLALYALVEADAQLSVDQVDARLRGLLDEWAEHREIQQTRRGVVDRLRELDERLEPHPEMRSWSHGEATARLEEAMARAEEVAGLADEIARIEERVDAAARSGELEARAAAVEEALADLAAARDELTEELAGDFLLDDVEAEYERYTQPARLRVAGELFSRFTHHRYRLELDRRGDAGTFRAIDTETGRGLSLGELSDGTRMQLLLAARLAFAIHAEGSHRPPIFLDEALTASDPERFRAVAGALFELAAEGRQIFYLTCNPVDVSLFERFAGEAGVPRMPVFDLAKLRGRAAAFSDDRRLAVPERIAIPEPGDDSADTYAMRLGVPRPLPEEGAARLHLFHVLRDDLPLLHRLLVEARVERIGHWHALRGSPAVRRLLDDDERGRIDAAVAVAERYVEAFSIGRGRRVDRGVLEASAAVSESFLARMIDLASDLDGDAQAIIAALEDKQLPNFRASKIEELRLDLEASGHLDPAEPLDAAALRIRALSAVPDSAWASAGGFDVAAAHRLIDSLELLFEPAG